MRSFLLFIIFYRELINSLINNLFLLIKKSKVNILNILIFLILFLFSIFLINKIYIFINSTDSLLRSVFLFKFNFSDEVSNSIFEDTSIGSRLDYYSAFFKVDPLKQLSLLFFGTGAGSFNSLFSTNPHSLLLDIFFNGGLSSLVLFISLIFFTARKIYNSAISSKFLILYFMFFILICSFIHDFGRANIFWIFFSLYVNVLDSKKGNYLNFK